MHAVIEDHEVYRKLQDDMAAVRDRREELTAQATSESDAYQASVQKAFAAGKPIPDPPSSRLDPSSIHMAAEAELARLDKRFTEWLAANADELLEQMYAREDEIM